MTELIIDGENIELANQEAFPSSQIADIGSVEDIYSGITKQIKLPKSRLNKLNLKGLGDVNTISQLPYQKPSASLKIEGFEVFQRGIALINSSDKNINVVLRHGNTNFFSELGDSIRSIDMSDLDQLWDITTIVNSQNNTYADGVIWSLIDFGQQIKWPSILCRRMFPSVFVCEIIDRIIEESGFYKVGEFWTSEDYRSMILPCVTRFTSDSILANMGVSTLNNTQYSLYGSAFGLATNIDMPWTAITDVYNLIQSTGIGYVAQVDLTLNVSAIIETYFGNATVIVSTIKVDQLGIETTIATESVTSSTISAVITITLNATNLELLAGEYIKINVDYNPVSPSGQMTINPSWLGNESYFTISNVQATETNYGLGYPIAQNLPDISKKDLIKAVAQMHGLMFNVNPTTNQIEIGRFEDIVKNKSNGNFYDWSDKLDLFEQNGDLEQIPINFRLGKYGQETWFRFAEDDTVTPDLGDDSFLIPDENLPKTGTLVKLIFAPSEMVYRCNGVIEMPYINTITEESNASTYFKLERQDVTDRILWHSPTIGTLAFYSINHYQQITGTLATATFKDATTLLAANYEAYQQTLKYFKKISPKVQISTEIFANFNHFHPIFFKQLGWFYCQKINGFTEKGSTKVDLISLSNFISSPSPKFTWHEQGTLPESGTDVQTLTLSSGTSYISLYVKPNITDVKELFESLGTDLNYIEDEIGNRYTESTGVNDIGDWDYHLGYKIVMNSAATIDITGVELDDYFVVIGIEGGQSWQAHSDSSAISIVTQLSVIVDDVGGVFNTAGQSYVPVFGVNTIGNLIPGEAYRYSMIRDRQLVYDGVVVTDFNVDFISESTDYLSLRWDFGDGSFSSDTNPTHEYSETGKYTVTLRATNVMGEIVESIETILVRDPNPGYKFNQVTNSGYLIGF